MKKSSPHMDADALASTPSPIRKFEHMTSRIITMRLGQSMTGALASRELNERRAARPLHHIW
jgi:hypothetical protein